MDKKKIFSRQLIRLLLLFFAGLAILAVIYFQSLPDGKLHLIFCDVGQGDAILLLTPAGAQILIDGGPDNSVLSCLGRNLPFYDKNLELVVLTHPQADHLTGLVSVFENYKVEKVIKTLASATTPEFQAFGKALKDENSQIFNPRLGSKINLGQNLQATVFWPNQDFSSLGTFDLNDTSIVARLDFGKFCALLTGDATNFVWLQLLAQGKLSSCFLVKIAHHGSKNSTNPEFLDIVSPKIAVISAGSNNRYGHPHEEVLEELEKRQIQILRTDEKGMIEIVTDGKSVQIK